MDLYQFKGLKKISLSKLTEAYKDDELICPFCSEFVDQTFNTGEFRNDQTGYISVECDKCKKMFAVRFFEE